MKDFEEMNTSETEYTVTSLDPEYDDEAATLDILESAMIF